eukprot:CAMPEP_0113296726 /NCGR_PEP_ID=MMETSP0008_2-20120614/37142_1 /TAXON_ID=97485 /ORGANISM="Prymnesium parvum" /LENGTH=73 /DNA_ID=CAMNT_0000149537 /DNA_START=139 /DNA_END=361 /DNA_ORIENTATION=+ /assembly_acc=CAM_ASM_000153
MSAAYHLCKIGHVFDRDDAGNKLFRETIRQSNLNGAFAQHPAWLPAIVFDVIMSRTSVFARAFLQELSDSRVG